MLLPCTSANPTSDSSITGRAKEYNFPFVNNNATVANLAQELSLYIAAADGVNVACEEDKVTWWTVHRDTPSTLVCTCQETTADSTKFCCSRKSFQSPCKSIYATTRLCSARLPGSLSHATIQQGKKSLTLLYKTSK